MNRDATESPRLKPFGNPVSITIIWVIIVLGGVGILLALLGKFLGIIVFVIGMLILKFGLTKFSPDKPRIAGLLTRNGVPIKGRDGNGYVVGGITILMDYFPFYIGAIPIDITNQDKDFPVKITCKGTDQDGNVTVQLEGIVSVSWRPDLADLQDYVDSGSSPEKIWAQLDDIVENRVRSECKDKSWLYLVQEGGEAVGDFVRRSILDHSSFGIDLFKIQIVLNAPSDLVKGALNREIELQQRQSDLLDYATMRLAAKELWDAFELDPKTRGKYGLDDCLQMIQRQHQIQEGRSVLIDSAGVSGAINIANFTAQLNQKGGGS